MKTKILITGVAGFIGMKVATKANVRTTQAARKSLGKAVSFGDQDLRIQDIETFDFTEWQIALFAIGSEATKKYAHLAAKSGCLVIDNSSLYRYDPLVPLIVPEVNQEKLDLISK